MSNQASKVVVSIPITLSWDMCSLTHLKTHSPMHLEWILCMYRSWEHVPVGYRYNYLTSLHFEKFCPQKIVPHINKKIDGEELEDSSYK